MKYFFIIFIFLFPGRSFADFTEDNIKQFRPFQSTYEQVITTFGNPVKSEIEPDGVKVIAYYDQNTHLNAASIISLAGALASIFVPGVSGLTASSASMVSGAIAGGASGKIAVTDFVFDRNGLLMNYQASITESTTGTFSSKTSNKITTAYDNCTPMPNITLVFASPLPTPPGAYVDGEKPRIGIQYEPISALDKVSVDSFNKACFKGVVVVGVAPGSPADKAGIKNHDYIYMVNGFLSTSLKDISQAMSTVQKGDSIIIHAKRINTATNLVKDMQFTVNFY